MVLGNNGRWGNDAAIAAARRNAELVRSSANTAATDRRYHTAEHIRRVGIQIVSIINYAEGNGWPMIRSVAVSNQRKTYEGAGWELFNADVGGDRSNARTYTLLLSDGQLGNGQSESGNVQDLVVEPMAYGDYLGNKIELKERGIGSNPTPERSLDMYLVRLARKIGAPVLEGME